MVAGDRGDLEGGSWDDLETLDWYDLETLDWDDLETLDWRGLEALACSGVAGRFRIVDFEFSESCLQPNSAAPCRRH